MNSPLPSRQVALEQGLRQYQAARPCSKGHLGARYISGNCVQCANKPGARAERSARKGGTFAKRVRALTRRDPAVKVTPMKVMSLYAQNPVCPVTLREMVRPGDAGQPCDQVCIEIVAGKPVLISREGQKLIHRIGVETLMRISEIYRKTS